MTDVFDTAGIQARLQAFRDEREWQEFHDPRSLTLALTAEVGELAQALAWMATAAAKPRGCIIRLLHSSGAPIRRTSSAPR